MSTITTQQLVLQQILALPQPKDSIQYTYVWPSTYPNALVRSKTRTLDADISNVEELPRWATDVFSLIPGKSNHEIMLKPVRLYKDPLLGNANKLVLCNTFDSFDSVSPKPNKTNERIKLEAICALPQVTEQQPWFGIEQEYVILDTDGHPYGWPKGGLPQSPVGQSYASVGADSCFGRSLVEAHYRACLYAGIKLWGIAAEYNHSQWEYQIGPSDALKTSDDLWMSRFLLQRIAESMNLVASFDSLAPTNGPPSCGQCNFSTIKMRSENGLEEIRKKAELLCLHHEKHLEAHGEHSTSRLKDDNATQPYIPRRTTCSIKAGDRTASIRIPAQVFSDQKGYLEDRRPGAETDPYIVIERILKTCCLNE